MLPTIADFDFFRNVLKSKKLSSAHSLQKTQNMDKQNPPK